MSAESKPTVEDDDSVSMMDILAQESRLQEDASAVLGGSDDQDCTYKNGYVKRQALYACATCATTDHAGVCLACSYHCHEGHDLYELYTKRHFRCDCGNNKFKDNKCKLLATKSDVNEENKYSQNFKGTYCTCSRPYPDPDDEIEDDMIQCIVCEDWYHGRHLGTEVAENHLYQEMTCTGCMTKHPFLWAYQIASGVEAVLNESGGDEKIDVEGEESGEKKPVEGESNGKLGQQESVKEEPVENSDKDLKASSSSSPENALKRKMDDNSSSTDKIAEKNDASSSADSEPPLAKQSKMEESKEGVDKSKDESSPPSCFLRELQKRQVTVKDSAAFWQEGWREKLCSCDECLSMCQAKGLGFLLDKEDTVSTYEEKGRHASQPPSVLEQENSILAGMDRVQQIEMISGFNDLKSELSDFLKTFAESGKVVKEEDIKKFFEHMEKRKKERMPAMQYFCK